MKKVNHLPACLPAALGFHDNSRSPSALPQQGSDRRVTEKGCGKSEPWVLALAGHWAPQDGDAHLASLCLTLLIHPLHKSKCARGPGLLSLFCMWFLPCSPRFPPQLGPSTVSLSPHQVLCDAVLLPHLTSFSLIPVFLL